jgi:hypothetical protein
MRSVRVATVSGASERGLGGVQWHYSRPVMFEEEAVELGR